MSTAVVRSSFLLSLMVSGAVGCLVGEPDSVQSVSPDVGRLPVARAGADQTVTGGSTVTLDGSTSSGRATLAFHWAQDTGPQVVLSNPNNAIATFVAPSVSASTVLQFTLTVTNSRGSSTDSVNVTVVPTGSMAATVATGSATNITTTSATLNGSVNPNGVATTYHFEWGPTTAYGTNVPVPDGSTGSGTTAIAVSSAISGLTAGQTYHFRLVATNANGTTDGADASFATTSNTSTSCTGVTVNTTDNLANLISNHSSGTTFCILGGIHRIDNQGGYLPLSNDVFIGVGTTAVISGAKQLTGWTVSGSNFVATGFLPSAPSTNGPCLSAFPLCAQQHDIFRDGAWLQPVSSLSALAPGRAFLDYANNKIYVRDDPNSHLMEQSWATRAFGGSGTGVQLKNLTIGIIFRIETGIV